jgi:cytochrome P450
MAGYAFNLIERLRVEPDDSIFSHIVHASIPGNDGEPRALDEMELVSFFNLLITGGIETTSNAIAAGMHTLLSHPEQYAALQRDFEGLADNAVEEILRYTSPVHFNRRTASVDVEYRGHSIKRGEKVTVWYPSANRDEAVFEEPDQFDIRRANAGKHVAFGHGIHHCLGAALARLEIRIILDEFIRMYGDQTATAVGALRYIRSNRHQGVAEARISIH